jgi:hypothetical protein
MNEVLDPQNVVQPTPGLVAVDKPDIVQGPTLPIRHLQQNDRVRIRMI